MVSVLKHGLLVQAFICGQWAHRVSNQLLHKEPDAAADLRSIFAQPRNLICGGGEIRTLLTSHPSVDGIRNMPWQKVVAIADEYLKTQVTAIPDLAKQIENLKSEIIEKKQHEEKKTITEEEIMSLITASLEAKGSFGSLDIALQTQCGAAERAICRQFGVKSSTYRKCSAAFEEQAKPFFTGKVKVNSLEFRKVCDKMLPGDPKGEANSYCDELCQSFTEIAQTFSAETAGEHAGSSSMKLEAKLLDLQQQLKYAIAEKDECKNARDALLGFRLQLDGLQKDIKHQFEKVQDARESYDEYEENVFDIEQELDVMDEALATAIQSVQGSGTKVTKARNAWTDLQAREKDVKMKLANVEASFKVTNNLLRNAHAVSEITGQLKGLVSQTMLNMALYFDEAVREPLRFLGLDDSMDVDEQFQESPENLPSATDFDESIGQLDSFCKKEALPAFAKVKSKVNLSPICNIGSQKDIIDGVNEAVAVRMDSVKGTIKHVQTWLDPYKGQVKMTESNAKRMVEQGEPEGLREVMGDFGQTSYYKEYLKQWKKGGAFLDIYERMGDQIAELETELDGLSKNMDALTKVLDEVLAQLKQATTDLEDAIRENELATADREEAQNAVQKQQEVHRRASEYLEALKKAWDDARKAYEAARKLLEEVHHKGTNLVQLRAW